MLYRRSKVHSSQPTFAYWGLFVLFFSLSICVSSLHMDDTLSIYLINIYISSLWDKSYDYDYVARGIRATERIFKAICSKVTSIYICIISILNCLTLLRVLLVQLLHIKANVITFYICDNCSHIRKKRFFLTLFNSY